MNLSTNPFNDWEAKMIQIVAAELAITLPAAMELIDVQAETVVIAWREKKTAEAAAFDVIELSRTHH